MIDLRNSMSNTEIPENKNPNKMVHIIEQTFAFNKQQKGKGRPSDLAHVVKVFDCVHIKILIPKQMLQRLLIALPQVKAEVTNLKFY